jgi:hypothetical protein
MAKITIWSYVVACDPGCNNISSYKGTIDMSDVTPTTDLTRIVDDKWWLSEVGDRFGQLTFVALEPDGAVFHYGAQDVVVPYGSDRNKLIDKVGLSYAYAELCVQVTNE